MGDSSRHSPPNPSSRPVRETTLSGITVVVTRPAAHGRPLADALAARGATAHCLPTIAIDDPVDWEPLDRAIERIRDYDWVVFTSANGVERLASRAKALRHAIQLDRTHIAAIGPATAAVARDFGWRVDVVAEQSVAEGLAATLTERGSLDGARILLARAAVGRDVLPDRLRDAGASVDVVTTYRTVVAEESRAPLVALADSGQLDFATFTSSSTATNFVTLLGEERARAVRAICAGPVTTATACALGLRIAAEVDAYSVSAMVMAIANAVRDR